MVRRSTARRHPYMIQEAIVPRIYDQTLDCVIYLYPSRKEAEAGEGIGGSGFLLGVQCESRPHEWWFYAVTNRHVIDKGHLVIRLNTKDGKTDFVETDIGSWEFHASEDLAMCAIKLSRAHKAAIIQSSRIVHEVFTRTKPPLIVGPGSDVSLLGRFIGHDGKQRNWPTVRFGSISMMPTEPIYNSHTDKSNPAFLVEVRSMGGYSGSPVLAFVPQFADIEVTPTDGTEKPHVQYRRVEMEPTHDEAATWLLGVVCGHVHAGAPVSLETDKWGGSEAVPTEFFAEFNTGMAIVNTSMETRRLARCR